MKYIYEPVFLDKCDPRVIEGEPIKENSIVEITKKNVDPCSYFYFIKDTHGNRQSVNKASLRKLTARELKWMPKDPTNLTLYCL